MFSYRYFVHFLESFDVDEHACIVTEELGDSLYDVLKKNGYHGFPMKQVRSYAKQMLEAISYLHRKLNLTHTDLKPENVLLNHKLQMIPHQYTVYFIKI